MTHKVLLVDDVADLRYLLRVVLETDGSFEIVGEAADGRTAMEIAERTQPDVIVLDLSMPTMDGLEALPRLRQLAPRAKIAVLSGFDGGRLAKSTSQLGADAYFEKGTKPDAVVRSLKALLGLSLERQPAAPAAPAAPAGVTELAGTELGAIVAHDIKSPLGTVVGLGDTLVSRWDQLDDAKRRELARAMTGQARIAQLVADNLLSAREVDLDAVEVELTSESPAALLTDAATVLEPLVGDHSLEVRVDPDLPVVRVDRARLTQVLINLVSNAAKHAPSRTPIVLAAAAEGARVAIEVMDRGPGIPAGDRARVLEKHVRLSREVKGLGLGLYISSSFVRAMGGTLTIGEAPGGGARVVCRLRVADASG